MSDLDDGYHDNNVESDETEGPHLFPPRFKQRKSMDLEFHDLNLDDWEESENFKTEVKRNLPARNELHLSADDNEDSSSCDDSFGEASDDEEPDKSYLEELLDEEYHPERLNLLDSNIPPKKDKPQLQRTSRKNGLLGAKYDVSDSDSEPDRMENTTEDDESDWTPARSGAHSDTSSEIPQQGYAYDLSDHTDNQVDELSENGDWKYPDDEGNDTESLDEGEQPGKEDAFDGSPKRKNDPSRPSIKDQMERLGKSTKKSFRTVGNRAFFSHPFKGLTRTLSGGKRKPRKGLEQQEVA